MVDDLYSYWYPTYDRCLDFWSVESQVQSNYYQVAACMHEDVARHIADAHNKWYQDKVYAGYMDNITLSSINSIVRLIIADLDDDPDEQDFWKGEIMSDINQLADAPKVL